MGQELKGALSICTQRGSLAGLLHGSLGMSSPSSYSARGKDAVHDQSRCLATRSPGMWVLKESLSNFLGHHKNCQSGREEEERTTE